MKITSYKFKEVPSYRTASKPCSECGKRFTKTFKSSQTVNPWNNKSYSEIHQENEISNKEKEQKWVCIEEKCSKCIKDGIKDIKVYYISNEDWKELSDLKDSYLDALRYTKSVEKHINELFKGKAIRLKDSRDAIINDVSFWEYPNKIQLGYNVVRKDKKGLLEKDEYDRFSVPEVENV